MSSITNKKDPALSILRGDALMATKTRQPPRIMEANIFSEYFINDSVKSYEVVSLIVVWS